LTRWLAAEPPTSREQVGRVYGKLLAEIYAKASDANPPPGVEELRKVMLADDAPTAIPRDQVRDYFSREQRNKFSDLKRKIDTHQVKSRGAPPRAMMLVDAPHRRCGFEAAWVADLVACVLCGFQGSLCVGPSCFAEPFLLVHSPYWFFTGGGN